MAFLDEEEQQQGGAGTPAPQQPATVGGGAPAPTAAPGPEKGSGSFVNLQQYVDANRPQAQKMSQAVTGGITQEAGQARTGVQQAREQNLGQQSQLGQEGQRLSGGEQFINQQIQQAGSTPITEQNQQSFRQFRTGQDSGYKAADLSRQAARAEALQSRAQNFGTSAGRQEELSRTLGGQSTSYSQGQQSLDNLLLGGDRNLRRQGIKDVKAATQGLSSQVGELGSDIQQRMDTQSARRQALKEYTGQRLEQGAGEGIETELGQRGYADIEADLRLSQETKNLERQDYIDSLRGGIQGQNLSEAQLADLGMGAGDATFGVSALDYISAPGQASISQVASAEDAARYQALNQLAGRTGGLGLQADQIGQLPGSGVNVAGFGSAREAAQQQFLQSINPQMANIGRLDEAIGGFGSRAKTMQGLIDQRRALKAQDFDDASVIRQGQMGANDQYGSAKYDQALADINAQLQAQMGEDIGGEAFRDKYRDLGFSDQAFQNMLGHAPYNEAKHARDPAERYLQNLQRSEGYFGNRRGEVATAAAQEARRRGALTSLSGGTKGTSTQQDIQDLLARYGTK